MAAEKHAQGKGCACAVGPSGRNSEGPSPEERSNIDKGKKPLVFVDACIAISMARAASGAKGAEERFKSLFDLLSEKAGKKEVIVPYGATHDEIAGTESKAKNAELMFRMSKGAKWGEPHSIKALERKRAFEAFLRSEDPAYGREDVMDGEADPRCFINWINDPEAIDAVNKEKSKWTDDLNGLKSSSPESEDYTSALSAEKTYEIVSINRLFGKKKRDEPFDDRDERFLKKEVIPLAAGDLSNIETWFTLLGFFGSEQFQGMPWVNVERRILAYEMAKCSSFRRGDKMDLRYACAYLPFSSYYLTDNDMAAKLKTLELDSFYGCKVFSSTSIDIFENELAQK